MTRFYNSIKEILWNLLILSSQYILNTNNYVRNIWYLIKTILKIDNYITKSDNGSYFSRKAIEKFL